MHFTQLSSRLLSALEWVDLLPVLLLAVACWNIHRAPKGTFFDDPLNKQQGLALRGIFACVVMMFHLAGKYPETGCLFPRLSYWGPLAVSIFFGLSGYGIMSQYQRRKEYLDGFLFRRFKALWWPYFICSSLALIQWTRGDFLLLPQLREWFGVAHLGWFCSVLFLYYMAFDCGVRAARKNGQPPMVYIIAFVLLETVLMNQINPHPRFYKGTSAFFAGLALGSSKEKSLKLLKRHFGVLMGILVVIVVTHLSASIFFRIIAPSSKIITRCILHAFFFVGIAALSMKWQMGNRMLAWLGTVSYELYLSHGWVMTEIQHWWPDLNGTGYVYAVVAASLAMASALHGGIAAIKRKTVPARNGGD